MAAQLLGTIEEIWRYPVSSLGGEALTSAAIGEKGVAGDRLWAIVDAATGKAAQPEKEARWQPALFLLSRWSKDGPEIGFPDGVWRRSNDAELDARLSDHFGFAVAVRPYQAGESVVSAEHRYTPSPLHLIATGSLAHLAAVSGRNGVDRRRFRANLLVRTTGEPAFQEKGWMGHQLQMGDVVLHGEEETKRCGLTLISQPDIDEDPEILRSILRHNKRNFGIYCSVSKTGRIAVGDTVYLRAGA